jgi:phosphoserine phosphatase RsbU/P
MYLSAFYGLMDFSRGTFRYSNYGHLPQYLHRAAQGELESLKAHTSFLGLLFDQGLEERLESSISFEPGDSVLLFTDGVVEAPGARGGQFGEEKLKEFVKGNIRAQAREFNEALIDELKDFSRNSFNDDIFILNVKTIKETAKNGKL